MNEPIHCVRYEGALLELKRDQNDQMYFRTPRLTSWQPMAADHPIAKRLKGEHLPCRFVNRWGEEVLLTWRGDKYSIWVWDRSYVDGPRVISDETFGQILYEALASWRRCCIHRPTVDKMICHILATPTKELLRGQLSPAVKIRTGAGLVSAAVLLGSGAWHPYIVRRGPKAEDTSDGSVSFVEQLPLWTDIQLENTPGYHQAARNLFAEMANDISPMEFPDIGFKPDNPVAEASKKFAPIAGLETASSAARQVINDLTGPLEELREARRGFENVLLGEGYIVEVQGITVDLVLEKRGTKRYVVGTRVARPHECLRMPKAEAERIAATIKNGNGTPGTAIHVRAALDRYIAELEATLQFAKERL